MTNSVQANENNSDTLSMHSPNLVDVNVQKIMALFPNCITESEDENGKLKKAVDFDLLRQELSQSLVEGGQERYRLDWPGKRQAILEANSPIAKTLRPARDESVNFDTTENLFIEGDNLDALKLLQESYLGQVKMIYIDPPYNTGNDFIYEDDFAQDTADFLERSEQLDEEGNRLVTNTESNGRFHSDWLTMMYSRLKLARSLLSDDGIIFISIDDKEHANLRKICDEIFSVNNFIDSYVWESTFRPDNSSPINRKNAEYIICFSKNRGLIEKLNGHLKGSEGLPSLTKSSMKDVILNFKAGSVDFNINDGNYSSGLKSSGYELLNDVVVKNSTNYNDFSLKGRMIWGQSNLDSEFSLGTKIIIKTEGFVPYVKKSNVSNMAPNTIIPNTIVGDILEGRASLLKLFDSSVFSYPKPVSLIEYLASYFDDKEYTMMDFFSGSATSAQAIMNLNSIDQGSRRFIMIQLPDFLNSDKASNARAKETINNAINFCNSNNLPLTISEISKERIRRAGQKILADNQDKDGIENLDIGFRVLKVDSTNMKDVYYTPDNYEQAALDNLESHIKEDRTGEDLLFQVMLDWGVPLSLPIDVKDIQGSSVYYVGIDSLVACFDTLTTDLIDEISKNKPLKFVSSELAIAHDQDKTNIKARFAQLSPDTQVKFI